MTGDDDPRPIPVGEFPDPVLAYAVEDDGAVVRTANEAFRSAFGDVPDGTSLLAAFDRAGLSFTADAESVATHARQGDAFRTRAEVSDSGNDGTTYSLRVVPGSDDGGHLVFTDLTGVAGEDDLGADRVASVVSHDLRNPLDVAKAHLRAGRETGDDDHFERVAQAHDRMERIVRDVLTLARGEDAIDPSSSVDLEPVARDAWETVDTEDATLAVDGPLPTVTADRDRAQRLFENLFRNCVEHGSRDPGESDDATGDHATAAAGPTVRVGSLDASDGDDPGGRDGFYVADDGPGIPEGERDAVFEPGYSSHEHGTGLGLAIVERIATSHGWSVSATASDSGGARIEVRVDSGADE